MVKLIQNAAPIAALLIALGVGKTANAQLTPEFELRMTLTDTTPHGTIALLDSRRIGFDASATDGYDPSFGEDLNYPGGQGPGNDFFLTMPNGNISRSDIRQKPSTDSFSIDYKMSFSLEQQNGSIFWDPSQIPAAIKGIWIRNYYYRIPMLDMKNTNILTFQQDSALTWNYLIVTVFYNMEPRYIATDAVNQAPANINGLIASASVFPNPMPSQGALDLKLNKPAYVTITGCDVTGREVLHLQRNVSSGESMIDLSALSNVHGAVFLRIDAESGTRSEVKNVVLMRE